MNRANRSNIHDIGQKKPSRSGYISGHNVHRTLINGLFSCFLLHPVFTTYRVLYDCILRDMNNQDFLNATEYVRCGSGRKLARVGSRPKMNILAMLPNWFFRTIGRIKERKKLEKGKNIKIQDFLVMLQK